MSFSERERGRIRNILGFFVKESNKDILLVALFKRLFFLDRLSFLETGITRTNYTYSAKPNGPVPKFLENELKGIDQSTNPEIVGVDMVVKLKKPASKKAEYEESYFALTDRNWEIDQKIFTPYELRLLKKIAERCKDKTGAELIEESHRCFSWINAFQSGKGNGKILNFRDEIGSEDDPYNEEERESLDLSIQETKLLLSGVENVRPEWS